MLSAQQRSVIEWVMENQCGRFLVKLFNSFDEIISIINCYNILWLLES